MALNFQTLDILRQRHPAWRLLASPHAPLIISFFHLAFIESNIRVMTQANLVEALEDELFSLRDAYGDDKFPKSALEYLNDWAAPEKGWLRKFYRQDSDEACFDLTPASEKAITWLESLSQRSFVDTESRLLMLFGLLRQISHGSTANPEHRLQELQKRRAEIDAEIAQVVQGNVTLLDDTAPSRIDSCNSISRRVNCYPIFVKSNTISGNWIAAFANKSPNGAATRANCSKQSWENATPSRIPIKAAAFAPSGIF